MSSDEKLCHRKKNYVIKKKIMSSKNFHYYIEKILTFFEKNDYVIENFFVFFSRTWIFLMKYHDFMVECRYNHLPFGKLKQLQFSQKTEN